MSIRISAPLPAPQTTLRLPNPELGDTQSYTNEIDIFRAVDGTKRTSVKRKNGKQRLSYNFTLDELKKEALQAFVKVYHSQEWRIVDAYDDVWEVKLASNPVEFAQGGRHSFTCQLILEGRKVS